MDEFSKNLSSLSWWLGVVVVGLLLNIASAYLKAPLDRILSAMSTSWNLRSETLRASRDAQIKLVRESDRELQLLIAEELRDRLRAIHTTLLAVFFILFYVFIRVRVPSADAVNSDIFLSVVLKGFYWASLLMLFLSMHAFSRAMATRSILKDASC